MFKKDDLLGLQIYLFFATMNMKKDDASVASNASTAVAEKSTTKTPQDDSKSTSSSAVVTKLASNDVLMGRGAAVIGNEGNRRFRKLIQKYKNEYDATRIRQEKDRIARKIVDTIVSREGRFLKKIETPSQAEFFKVPTEKSAWVVVKEAVVLQKVKQAFRDDRRSFEEDRSNNSKSGVAQGIPSALKAPLSGLKTDALLGDTTLVGSPSLVNASLLMRSANASGMPGGFFPMAPQQLLPSQLDSQLLLLAASRQQQQRQLDPFAVLRSGSGLLDNRTLLLRQVLARESALAALNHQATLREQLASLGNSSGRSSQAQPSNLNTLSSAFLR